MIPAPRRRLIKLGGAALSDGGSHARESLANLIRYFHKKGDQVIVVHGGGPSINEELRRRGIQWSFVRGQRVTSPEMMETIESTLCGQVNRQLVRGLCAQEIQAFGLAGTDNGSLKCSQLSQELGQVGKIEKVNLDWLLKWLDSSVELVPVIAPVGIGEQGECFNINADWSAAHIASSLKAQEIVFLTDQNGILDEDGSVISSVTVAGLKNMIEARVVSGGMLTKTESIIHALTHGVKTARVMKARSEGNGTHCLADDFEALSISSNSFGEESNAPI